jgi:hypothetical protein
MDFQILKHGFNVKFQNEKIKWIFPILKTCFQGEISECKNKIYFLQKLKHGSKVTFQNAKIKRIFFFKNNNMVPR